MRTSALLAAVVVVGVAGVALWEYRAPLLTLVGVEPAQSESDAKPKSGSEAKRDPNRVEVSAEQQKQLGLQTDAAMIQEIVERVHVPGTVMFDERRITHLRPRTKGRVLSLAVQPGDAVRAGETVATLDASGVLDARNGLEAATATLVETQSALVEAQIALKRAGALLKIGGISQAELERRQTAETKAQSAVQSAEAKLAMYKAQYERLAPEPGAPPGTSAIVSPISGVVTASKVTVGEVIDTNQDAFTVADPTRMIVQASLFGNAVDRVKPGDPATIDPSSQKIQAFTGHVASVNASLEPVTNAASARIEVENRDGLLKGNMFVTTQIMADLGRRGVTIPADAVQQTEQGKVAFVRTSPTSFERRILTLGLQRSDWVEVENGVSAGEAVADKGSFGLKAILLKNLLGATD